jgi:hypothetical protein
MLCHPVPEGAVAKFSKAGWTASQGYSTDLSVAIDIKNLTPISFLLPSGEIIVFSGCFEVSWFGVACLV